MALRVIALIASLALASAFAPSRIGARARRLSATDEVETCLKEEYPEFAALVFQNEGLWRGLRDGDGYTILAPNGDAFANLEEKVRGQLSDPRNGEVVEQLGAYHAAPPGSPVGSTILTTLEGQA